MHNPQEITDDVKEFVRLKTLWGAPEAQNYLKELMSEEGGEGVIGGNYISWITSSKIDLVRIDMETAYFRIAMAKTNNRFYAEWIVSKFGYHLMQSLHHVCKNSYIHLTSFIINTPDEKIFRDTRAVAYGKVVYDPKERPPLPEDACRVSTNLPGVKSIGDLVGNLDMHLNTSGRSTDVFK